MLTDKIREKIFEKEDIKKIDLVTLSILLHAVEEALEEVERDEQSISTAE